jgi:hypothetical protein
MICTEQKNTHFQQPREVQSPTPGFVTGGAGGATPLQNMLRRLGPPQSSVELPAHAMLQSVSVAFTLEFSITSPQSASVTYARLEPRAELTLTAFL